MGNYSLTFQSGGAAGSGLLNVGRAADVVGNLVPLLLGEMGKETPRGGVFGNFG